MKHIFSELVVQAVLSVAVVVCLFTRSLSRAMCVCARLSSSRDFWTMSSLAASSFLDCVSSFWIDFNIVAFEHSSPSRADRRLRNADKETSEWVDQTEFKDTSQFTETSTPLSLFLWP